MDKQEIVAVLKDLYRATHFRMSLHDRDFNEIAAYPSSRQPFCAFLQRDAAELERCLSCDRAACREAQGRRSTTIYKCRYGLTEAISPLYNFGTLTGFLMMGQVLDESESTERLAERIAPLAESRAAADELVRGIPRVSREMCEVYVRIMTLSARYLTLANALPSKNPSLGEAAKRYVAENYARKISIRDICHELDCSKSKLLTCFKRQFGQTVGEFITQYRLNEAKRLLKGGELSINEIAHATGFYDQSYFTKVFSTAFACTPSEYRRGATEEAREGKEETRE